MTTTPAHPALAYAEQSLGVHSVYTEVTELLQELDGVFTELDKAQDQRRDATEKIADREAELIHELWGRHADSSANRIEQLNKIEKRKDTQLSGFRADHNLAVAAIQGLEYDADMLKLRIRAKTARLEELGGYLQYLAAVKLGALQAEKITQPNHQENQ